MHERGKTRQQFFLRESASLLPEKNQNLITWKKKRSTTQYYGQLACLVSNWGEDIRVVQVYLAVSSPPPLWTFFGLTPSLNFGQPALAVPSKGGCTLASQKGFQDLQPYFSPPLAPFRSKKMQLKIQLAHPFGQRPKKYGWVQLEQLERKDTAGVWLQKFTLSLEISSRTFLPPSSKKNASICMSNDLEF